MENNIKISYELYNVLYSNDTKGELRKRFKEIIAAARDLEDYQYVEGNPDQQASDQVLAKIIKKQMIAMRRGDKSLYKEYKNSEAFQYGMLQAVKGFIANRDHIRV